MLITSNLDILKEFFYLIYFLAILQEMQCFFILAEKNPQKKSPSRLRKGVSALREDERVFV
jgi:hypothetical protein